MEISAKFIVFSKFGLICYSLALIVVGSIIQTIADYYYNYKKKVKGE